MDIPYYEYIYDFPGGHNQVPPQHSHTHLTLTHAIETSKEVKLFDAIGNIRYIVKLCSTETDEGLGFKVMVVLFYPNEQPDVNNPLLVIPEDPNTYEYDYNVAQKTFGMCVQKYDSLLKAETKDFRDIDVYAEKIGYEKTQPECCKFCKWCVVNSYDNHIECHNPKNQRQFLFMADYLPTNKKKVHRLDAWQKLPWQKCNPFCGDEYYRNRINTIYPKVDDFGKCKNYEPIVEDINNQVEQPIDNQPEQN